jgi:hypothetical protein
MSNLRIGGGLLRKAAEMAMRVMKWLWLSAVMAALSGGAVRDPNCVLRELVQPTPHATLPESPEGQTQLIREQWARGDRLPCPLPNQSVATLPGAET